MILRWLWAQGEPRGVQLVNKKKSPNKTIEKRRT